MRFKLATLLSIATLLIAHSPSAQALTLPHLFISYANSKVLSQSGIILIDPKTSETIYSHKPDVGRAPASVLKLLSATLASSVLDLNSSFHTSIAAEAEPNRYLLTGEFDPWLTASSYESHKYGAAFSPDLINQVLKIQPGVKRIVIDYYGLNADVLKKYFRGRVYLSINKLPSEASTEGRSITPLGTITSPTVADILKFTLMWSDNVKADRLAKLAARAEGYPASPTGIYMALMKTLGELGISTEGLKIYDGSGLSKANRVAARTIAELLIKIQNDPKFAAIYQGLPLAGESGTLRTRFVKDAPSAVGLIKAKTGWINRTVSLAGYVTAGAKDYVFVVIDDHVIPTEARRQAVRVAIDKMLATIAKPKPSI
jgi:D-alanyl-D-alanine carboxypeptidase